MTTDNHTPIVTGAAADASVINAPLGELDSVIGSVTNLLSGDSNLVAAINANAARPGPNALWDTFNQYYDPANGDFDGRLRWYRSGLMTLVAPDAANPFGNPTLRIQHAGGADILCGKYFWWDELGAQDGDVLTFKVLANVASGTLRLYARSCNDAGTNVGSPSTTANYSFSGAAQVMEVAYTCDADSGSTGIYIDSYDSSGAQQVDIYAMWGGVTGHVSDSPAVSPFMQFADILADLDDREIRQNLIFDPFNRDAVTPGATWNSRSRYYNAAGDNLTIVDPDASNPFGAPTLRHDSGSAIRGKMVWWDEIGAQVGDVITCRIYGNAASGDFAAYARNVNASGSLIGSNYIGLESTFSGAAQMMQAELTVESGSAGMVVCSYRISGSAVFDIYWMGAFCNSRYLGGDANTHRLAEIEEARFGQADLAAGIDYQIAAAGDASRSLEYAGRRYMRSWMAQISKILEADATEQAHIVFLGDSWTRETANRLRAWLRAEYGNAGTGFLPFGPAEANHDGALITRAGTWTESDQLATSRGVNIAHIASSDAATPARLSFSATFTDGAVHYIEQSGGGDFRYRVDGGAWQSVATAGASTAFATAALTGLSNASHTIEIEITAAGSGVILTGFLAVSDVNGVIVSYAGNGGLGAEQMAAVDATIWQDGLAALSPHVLMILTGTNDHSNNIVPGTFYTQVETVIDRARTAVPLVDVLLLSPFNNGLTGKTYTVSDYDNKMQDLAAAEGCGYVSGYRIVPDYTAGNSRGIYLNTSHPNDDGYMLLANAVGRFLRER